MADMRALLWTAIVLCDAGILVVAGMFTVVTIQARRDQHTGWTILGGLFAALTFTAAAIIPFAAQQGFHEGDLCRAHGGIHVNGHCVAPNRSTP